MSSVLLKGIIFRRVERQDSHGTTEGQGKWPKPQPSSATTITHPCFSPTPCLSAMFSKQQGPWLRHLRKKNTTKSNTSRSPSRVRKFLGRSTPHYLYVHWLPPTALRGVRKACSAILRRLSCNTIALYAHLLHPTTPSTTLFLVHPCPYNLLSVPLSSLLP